MLERIVSFPYFFDGTTVNTQGTQLYITPYPMTFRSLSIWVNAVDGGTVRVEALGTTLQGTACGSANAARSGTLYTGTAAFLGNGTSIDSLHVIANGTISIYGSAVHTPTQMSGLVLFTVDE